MKMTALLLLAAAWQVVGCGDQGSVTSNINERLGDRTVQPGTGVGRLKLGMRFSEVRALLGEAEVAASQRLAFVRYPALDLELVFTSSVTDAVTPDSLLIAIGVRGSGWQGEPRPGMTRQDVERSLGAGEAIGPLVFFARGATIEVAKDDPTTIVAVAVVAPWTEAQQPPPMARAGLVRGGGS